MPENFRVSTNSVRVLRQLTMRRVLISLSMGEKTRPNNRCIYLYDCMYLATDWITKSAIYDARLV